VTIFGPTRLTGIIITMRKYKTHHNNEQGGKDLNENSRIIDQDWVIEREESAVRFYTAT
jgi:hypothetical protein